MDFVWICAVLVFLLKEAVSVLVTEYSPDKYPSPEFLPTNTQVSGFVGDVVALYCSVRNLGTKTVIWRKASDPTPLTIGKLVYVEDSNLMINHVQHTGQWNLLINNVTPEYSGVYECQVSTKGRTIRKLFTLQVKKRPTPRPPDIRIYGNEYVEKGGTINLVCNATGGDYPPEDIDWFKDGNKLFSNFAKGVSIAKHVSLNKRLIASVFEVKRASVTDAGTYICRTSDSQVTSLKVNVLNAETFNRKRDDLSSRRRLHFKNISPKITQSSYVTVVIFLVLVMLL